MEATNKNLVLFQYEQPELVAGLGVKTVKNGVVVPVNSSLGELEKGKDTASMILTIDNRKAVAKRLGIVMNKENAGRIDSEILRMKDNFMKVAVADLIKRAVSGEYTGASYRVSQAKQGKQKVALSLERVNRTAHSVSDEQFVKALASMTPEQLAEMQKKAEELKEASKPAVELESLIDASKAEIDE